MTTLTDNEIKQTVLFKQVSSVLDESVALNLLKCTYDDYDSASCASWCWEWNDSLYCAFEWSTTKQGRDWWCMLSDMIYDKV